MMSARIRSLEAAGWNGRVAALTLSLKVLALQQGASIKSVRSQLGMPISETGADEEQVLLYGPRGRWHLVFSDGDLERRTREYPSGRLVDNGKALDRKVLALRRGLSMDDVESALGEPSSRLLEYLPEKVESLWYGSWQLSFIDGKLDIRTNW